MRIRDACASARIAKEKKNEYEVAAKGRISKIMKAFSVQKLLDECNLYIRNAANDGRCSTNLFLWSGAYHEHADRAKNCEYTKALLEICQKKIASVLQKEGYRVTYKIEISRADEAGVRIQISW